MIHSMTGYGQAAAEFGEMSYWAEIRTVNNRYLKLNMRLPETASFAEDEIEKVLRSSLSRGMVNFSLKIRSSNVDEIVNIDPTVLQGYVAQIKNACRQVGIDENINIAELLPLPGVITAVEPDKEKALELLSQIKEVVKTALDCLGEMRIEEGKALYEDLKVNCSVIAQRLDEIEQRIDKVIDEYYEKLKKRVDQLLSSAQLELDEDLLAREVAVFAERCDISEEISRLKSHLNQFDLACKAKANAGRKLDFITQEMLREANTIGSKASDAQIANNVVDIKCAIDRLKEQVQNVE